ncbi:MAG: NAD(P)/FAD-dependent oxidoreductase [Chitinophagales bacterium]
MSKYDVAIIGAGLAGLSAAIHLQNEGLSVKVLEASDAVGGRVRTDKVEGFLLDRGFQVLLTAYPEAQRLLNYNTLHLGNFSAGSLVRYGYENYRIADPFREPQKIFATFKAPFVNFADKMKMLALRNRQKRLKVSQIFHQKEQTTLEFLQEWNFSNEIIQHFFRPFLGGIFLEEQLQTSSRMFEFVFKMFGEGYAALPASGMQAIPEQLANQLEDGVIELNSKVVEIKEGKVVIEDGQTIDAECIIVATDVHAAKKLIPLDDVPSQTNGTYCLYFSTPWNLVKEPILMLNGNRNGLINNICVPNLVQPSYAPEGQSLLSVTVVKPTELTLNELRLAVQNEIREWFGEVVILRHLKTYHIPNALPTKTTIAPFDKKDIHPVEDNVYVCGDYTFNGSINAAMLSGRLTAEVIIENTAN